LLGREFGHFPLGQAFARGGEAILKQRRRKTFIESDRWCDLRGHGMGIGGKRAGAWRLTTLRKKQHHRDKDQSRSDGA
jgi:hypothetical protein